ALAGWGVGGVGVPDRVLVANVAWLARYRHPRCGSPDVARLLLKAFADPAPVMAGAAAAGDPLAVLPVLFHLMWRHVLVAGLAVRLTAENLVGPGGALGPGLGARAISVSGTGSGSMAGTRRSSGCPGRLSAWPTPAGKLSLSACPACWRRRTSPWWMPGRARGCRRSRCLTACPGRQCRRPCGG